MVISIFCYTAKFTAWLINCSTKTCSLIVLLSAGVFLLAYINAIHFLERQLDMAIKSESFSLIAFFRFTETYTLRIQSVNPHFDEEKHKKYTTKTPKKVSSITTKSQDAEFFLLLQSQIAKSVPAPGCQANSIWRQRGDSMASENTEPLKKREGHNRIKLSLSSSKKHFYV